MQHTGQYCDDDQRNGAGQRKRSRRAGALAGVALALQAIGTATALDTATGILYNTTLTGYEACTIVVISE